MAENLNYRTERRSCCYENNPNNCDKYGRLYDWKTAATVCPVGWKLPDIEDWNTLVKTVGGKWTQICEPETDNCSAFWDNAGKLKSKSEWGGTDDYGFSALPGGYRKINGSFSGNASRYGVWWTASMDELNGGYCFREMHYNKDYVYDGSQDAEGFGFSVRCLQDGSGTNSFGASDQTKTDDIIKLMKVSGAEKLVEQMMDNIIAMYKQNRTGVPATYWDRFRKKFNFSEIIREEIPIYDKYYTHDEIKQLIIFYESPVGKKSVEISPVIMKEMMAIGQKWGEKIVQELLKELMAEGYMK
jgi:uncharacterized protein (TIGR02145 family)